VSDYYKICRKDSKGNYKTLFHGIKKSKIMKVNEWLQAEVKYVTDGSPKTSKTYLSGWHVIKGKDNALKYMNRFKDKSNLVIVPCEVRDEWKKEHSRSEVYLSEWMKLKEN